MFSVSEMPGLLSMPIAILLAGVLAGSALATGIVLRVLRHYRVLDHPNERSSHAVPTPRGGGWGPLAAIVAGWAFLAAAWGGPPGQVGLAIGLAVLVAVSWLDDVRTVSVRLRLAVQFAAAAAGLAVLQPEHLVFQGWLPLPVDRAVAAVIWVWFVNLYNFMDGIDGITGTETVSIGTGIAALAALLPALAWHGAVGLVIAAAALGFLVWNWHPARIFSGDVGSIALGYLIGWLLLTMAAQGAWLPALLLPLYYLADASLTLVRRLLRGDRVWQAHRAHFYQRAVRGGLRPDRVCAVVFGVNAVLAAAAIGTLLAGPVAALPGAAAVAAVLAWFEKLLPFERR